MPLPVPAAVLAIWNGFVLLLYGVDKRRARGGRRRISERALLSCAFFLGATGALLGMLIFHHKTKKRRFVATVFLALVINTAAFIFFRHWA